MHIIFQSKAAADAFVAQADALLGLPAYGQINGEGPLVVLTQTWDVPIKHLTEELWAVAYKDEIAAILGDHVPIELPGPGWDPNWIEIPPG